MKKNFLTFTETHDKHRNRPKWKITNKKKEVLGFIEWSRKYFVFNPYFELLDDEYYYHPVFSHECLDEISNFLKTLEAKEQ